MRICRFNCGRVGLLAAGGVRDVSALFEAALADTTPPQWSDPLVAALPGLAKALAAYGEQGDVLRLDEVSLDRPVALPGKVIGAPGNYRDHVAEMGESPFAGKAKAAEVDTMGLFLKANSSLAGPSEPLGLRFPDRRTDHEVELVVVIGAGGSRISRKDALSRVAGYCLGLDITVRGAEERSFRKSCDGFSIIGPWLTTADEIDPNDIPLTLAVNGQIRQRASTASLIFGVDRLVEYASTFYTLYPGDLIYTGTPAGVGPIVAGDLIEADGGALGKLSIRVCDGPDNGAAATPPIATASPVTQREIVS